MEKLLSGKRDQANWELDMSFGGLALVASQGVLREDLVAEKQYSQLSASTMWTRVGLVPTDITG